MPIDMLREPFKTVVPLLGVDESSHIRAFLGSATFVGDGPFLATAQHVVNRWDGPFGITTLSDPKHITPADVLVQDRDADLALLAAPGYPQERALQLAQDEEIKLNHFVACLEYSTTTINSNRRIVCFSPATRLGNVTRLVQLTQQYGKGGEDMLGLSFRALRGASGAPIVSNSSFRLWGIVIANRSHYLLPSQVERLLDETGQIAEETLFHLPQGLAVHVKHLRALIQSLA